MSQGNRTNHPGPRTPEQRKLDRLLMVKLLRKGYSKVRIAEYLGVSPASIARDWRIVAKLVEHHTRMEAGCLKAKAMQELEQVKTQVEEEWQRSKQPAVKKVVERRPKRVCPVCNGDKLLPRKRGEAPKVCFHCEGKGFTGGVEKVVNTTEGRLGDPRYLHLYERCVAAERDLNGLDPPKNVNLIPQVAWEQAAIIDGAPDPIEEEIAEMKRIADQRQQEVQEAEVEEASPKPNGQKGNGHVTPH